jgi:hypothetical protein
MQLAIIFALGTASASAYSTNRETAMNLNNVANTAAVTINPLFLRHDLMIELGRVEMALADLRERSPSEEPAIVEPLQSKLSRINEALSRLAA